MILDTDVLIDLLRENPKAETWLRSLPALPALSGMAALEALFGSKSTTEMRKVRAYLNPFPILWPTEADAQTTSRLAPHRLSDGTDLIDAYNRRHRTAQQPDISDFQRKTLSLHIRPIDRSTIRT